MTKFEYRKYTKDDYLGCAVKVEPLPNSLLIAAAFHQTGFIPGLFNPEKNVCEIPWGCKSHVKEEFYILHMTSGSCTWTSGENGNVPPDAVVGGHVENGETLYIGKFNLNDKWLCGKIHQSHGVCYVPELGRERNCKSYLVLSASDYDPVNNPEIPRTPESSHSTHSNTQL